MNRGLIEACHDLRDSPCIAALPRFMNRGLIEAGFMRRFLGDDFLLPRFMNRGLIEAETVLIRNGFSDFTSPIHESGPH